MRSYNEYEKYIERIDEPDIDKKELLCSIRFAQKYGKSLRYIDVTGFVKATMDLIKTVDLMIDSMIAQDKSVYSLETYLERIDEELEMELKMDAESL